MYTPLPFTPETHVRNPDSAGLVETIRLINEASAEDFVAAVGARLDLRGFMRQAAVENCLADNDGLIGYAGMNNFYLYRFQSRSLATFIPWDFSEAFKGERDYSILQHISDVPEWARNRLMERTMAVPELRDVYFDTLLECASVMSTNAFLEQELLYAYDQIRVAALEDPVKPYSNEEFESDVQKLLDFARSRSEVIVAEVGRTR